MTTLKQGSKGDLVKALQYILNVEADGKFGKNTKAALVAYQKTSGLTVDGICGRATWNKIVENAPTLRGGEKNAYVNALETLLQTLTADGIYSSSELQHVKTFQSANGLTADGIVGRKTWELIFGLTAVQNNGTNTAQPVNYKQYDSRWGSVVYTKNNTYNKSQTIKSSGCGPTSMADIVATWWDKTVTPVELCKISVNKGYRTTNSGTAWGFFKYIANLYNASKFIQTSAYATAEAAIKQGALVVCSMGPGIWTKGGHYICWWKVDDTYVYINDPASAAANRAKSNKSNLKSQCKQYFIFYK